MSVLNAKHASFCNSHNLGMYNIHMHEIWLDKMVSSAIN